MKFIFRGILGYIGITVYALPPLALIKPQIVWAQSSASQESVSKPSQEAAEELTVLPDIEVSTSAVAEPTDGYMAKKSFSATRTDTPLRDVPQSITVITQDVIRDQTMQNLADVVRYVPGVVATQGEGNRDAMIFRGSSSTGDFFVDGLRDDVQYYRDLYNIDRVEVLKGSNGMIFGRGGAGGVINRVTKEADWTPVREITGQFGSFGHKRFTADLGQPIDSQLLPGSMQCTSTRTVIVMELIWNAGVLTRHLPLC